MFANMVSSNRVRRRLAGVPVWILGLLFAVVSMAGLMSHTADAVVTVPTKMNFQGRLTNSAGNTLADGTYNMTFRLFTASSGGSAVWTEVRAVSGATGVTVTNGLFSVKLGDVTALPASLFASGTLYLEIELPTPATATTSSPSYTEGAMTPRNQMATSAYAYNSETLDGLDSAAFAQVGAYNSFTDYNEFSGTTDFYAAVGFSGSVSHYSDVLITDTSLSAFKVQAASGGGALLTADTTNMRVMVGDGTPTEKLDIIGNWKVRDAATATKGVRVRTNGLDLDFEAAGDKIQFSTWSGADFTGTQYNQFRFNADGTPINVQRAMDLVNAVASDVALKITGAASQSTDLLQVKANASAIVMAVDPTGLTTFKNSTNSATAFQIQNSSATALFVADTVNSRLYVGNPTADATGALLVLDTKNTSGDPTGVNGGMYYNSNTSDFRCYVNGGWQSCQAQSASTSGLVTAANTYTGTTYANLPAPSSISYTKLGGTNTNLTITLTTSFYVLVAGTTAKIGVNIGGTDYDCGFLYFNSPSVYTPLACTVVIPSLTSGSKTIQARWKVNSASGSLNIGANAGWNSMTVIETN